MRAGDAIWYIRPDTNGKRSFRNTYEIRDEETYRKWQRNIPRVDKPLERNAALCELHFDPQFVSRHFEHIISVELVRLERSRPLLQPDAILTIFPNVPKYISKPVPKKSNPKEMLDPQFAPPQKRNSESTWPHPTHRMKHPRLPPTLDYQNVIVPSNQWGKHVFFSETSLFVAYSVCILGPIMSLLHAQKLVLFRCVDSMIEH
ncbi:hypothetical protein HPB49_019989 [Dermacentor silvarum]|uniref:Uncharacterized protein n=1 Tax=Dermacentor silvarum TaxID=543639 RepID=A0ACB8D7N3_DERSI|nr:hypothetical protein HPB49_019989 [Dermacentor silvarum]